LVYYHSTNKITLVAFAILPLLTFAPLIGAVSFDIVKRKENEVL
jgi:hypothetical protein